MTCESHPGKCFNYVLNFSAQLLLPPLQRPPLQQPPPQQPLQQPPLQQPPPQQPLQRLLGMSRQDSLRLYLDNFC